MEVGRALLLEMTVPKSYWSEDVLTNNYGIFNQLNAIIYFKRKSNTTTPMFPDPLKVFGSIM